MGSDPQIAIADVLLAPIDFPQRIKHQLTGLAQAVQKMIDVSRIKPIPPKHACGKSQVRVRQLEIGKRRLGFLDPLK
jgi:hypothetical protein